MSLSVLSIVLVLLGLGLFFWRFERRDFSSKEITLVAVLSSFAVVGRVAFAAVPSVQFATFAVIVSGYVFGTMTGFAVGCIAAFVSSLFLGLGPWTPWQMMAWGLCGGSSGLVGRLSFRSHRPVLMLLGFSWGYLFGWMMNVWMWLTFVRPLNLTSWLAVNASSFPFDTAHALSNVFFAALFGGDFIKILTRFRRRLHATYESVVKG